MDLVGIEPTTSSMPWKRAPSCATGPRLENGNAKARRIGIEGYYQFIFAHISRIVNAPRFFYFFPQASSAIIDRAPHLHQLSITI